jgi:broad specificity phosphatase PhoE
MMFRPTRLILIRHGHTTDSAGGRVLMGGRTDVPLNPRGYEEVRRLQRHLCGTTRFAAIYSSPLQRAWETAAALAGAGLGPVHLCPALREIDCGTLDGMTLKEVQRRFPQLWAANLRQQDDRLRWPGGESYREFRCRSLRAVRTRALAHRGGRVALVTHAGVITQILGFLAGTNPARWECFLAGHTALTELDWSRGWGTIVRFDDRAHLAEERH